MRGLKDVSSPLNSHQEFSQRNYPIAQSWDRKGSQFFRHSVENFPLSDQITRNVGGKHDSLVIIEYFAFAPDSLHDLRPVRIV